MEGRRLILFSNIVCVFLRCYGYTDFAGKECEPMDENGCKCKFTDESAKIVDLTSLGNTDSTPRFKDVTGTDGNAYSYNPCNGFDLGSCSNAAMCVGQGGDYQQIGDAGRTQFQYNSEDDSVLAAYQTHKSIITASVVQLICDPTACTPVLTPTGQSTVGMYNFQFTSVCSCPGMCDVNGPIDDCQPSSGSSNIGPGALIVIGLLGVTAIYLIGGTLYMKIVRKETGSNIIPNKSMWTSFFNLIRSGVLFSVSKCRGKAYEDLR